MGKDFLDDDGTMYFSLSINASNALMAHLRLLEAFVGEGCGLVEREWDGNIGVAPEQMHRFVAALARTFSGAPRDSDVVIGGGQPFGAMHDVFLAVYKGPAVVWMGIYHAAFGLPAGSGHFAQWRPEAVRYAEELVKPRIY